MMVFMRGKISKKRGERERGREMRFILRKT